MSQAVVSLDIKNNLFEILPMTEMLQEGMGTIIYVVEEEKTLVEETSQQLL